MGVFDVFQIPYSALQREHEELISEAARAGAGVLVRGGAARGTGAEDKNWAPQPIGLAENVARQRWDEAGMDDLLDGMSAMEFILRFTLSHPGLSSTIVGTRNVDHVRTNVEIASKGPLPDEVYEQAKSVLPTG
jgi:aryl-alcohol dehydrogenase-like predicted oxidoreductase